VRPRWLIAVIILGGVLLAVWWGVRPWQRPVTVYFLRVTQSGSTLVPVTRVVSGRGPTSTRGLVAAALEALIAGPVDAERARGLTSEIPSGTRLRGVETRDGVVRADFSREVEAGGGSTSMLGRFWQIVYTATQFPDAPRVRILLEGQEHATLGGEGVLIDHPIARPPIAPRF